MTRTKKLGGTLGALATSGLLLGCLTEYHPDFHPVVSYRYIRNVTTVLRAPSSPAPSSSPPSLASRDRALPSQPREAPPRASPPPSTGEASESVERAPVLASRGALGKPAGAELDAQLSASCLAGDNEACKRLAGLHLGGRKPGAAVAAPTASSFDRAIRGFALPEAVALVAGSNGGTTGRGPRAYLE